MNSILQLTKIYLQERLSFFPWFFVPVLLFFLGHKVGANFRYILAYNFLWGVFFFRSVGDIVRFEEDKKKQDWKYLKISKFYLLPFVFICFLQFYSSGIIIYPIIINLSFFIFTMLYILVSFLLRKTKFKLFPEVFMYPLFILASAVYTSATSYTWVYLGLIFFMIKYYCNDLLKKDNSLMEVVILTSFIFSKYVLKF